MTVPRSRDLVFVLPGLWASGGFRTIYEWMNRLAVAGVRVRVVAHCGGPGAELLDPRVETLIPSRWRYLSRSPIRVGAQRLLGDRNPLSTTPTSVLDLLPCDGDVVCCWAPWMPAIERIRPGILYTQHWEPVWFGEGSRQQVAVEAAMLTPRPTIVNSSWLRDHFPATQEPRLVFPGVDHAVFHPEPQDRPRSDGTLRIAALGRDEPFKGLAELRRALRDIPVHQPVELRLFGTGSTWTTTNDHVVERGMGSLSSSGLAALYRSSDLVVTPSWYESFPLPPLEAMACGVPVVTTAPGTEDYAVDGQNALVVPARDEAALAAAILAMTNPALRSQLAAGGLATAAQFTWDSGFRMFVDALDSLLAGQP